MGKEMFYVNFLPNFLNKSEKKNCRTPKNFKDCEIEAN